MSEVTHEPVRVWAQEINARFLRPLLDLLEERLGRRERDALLARLGTSDAALRDERAWVSLRFLEALYSASAEATGSSDVLHEAGRAGLSRRYLGPLFHWGRFFGTPGQLYASLPRASERFNRANEVELVERRPGQVVLRYGPRPGLRERSPLVCAVRREQLRAVPAIWNLPLAQIDERQCQSQGHESCVYDIRFQSPVRKRGGLAGSAVGVLIGIVLAMVANTSVTLGATIAALSTALGATLGWLVDHRRALAEARARATEQHQALSDALAALESRFEALLESERQRDAAEASRNELEAQLRIADRMSSLGMLAAGVAHEINNPLSFVATNLDYLSEALSGGSSPTEWLAATEEAREGTRRVQQIARRLKVFSREDSQVSRGPLALRDAIEPALTMVAGELEPRARLEVAFEHTRPVAGSAGELGQVFVNLLVNAAQAMPVGRLQQNLIGVRVYEDAAGHVVAEVSDTGPGIEGDPERIFQPFVTTKEEGTGLGLYICRRIVAEHGGTIEVETTPGKGTTFRVKLPALDLPAVEKHARDASPTASQSRLSTRQLRVLLVDDEPTIVRSLRRILREHDVHTAHSVADAKQRVLEQPSLDVVLCDLMMPGESGIDLHRWLTKERPALAARTIFVSGGIVGEPDRDYLERISAVCVDKPVEAVRLRDTLQEVAEGGQPKQTVREA